MIDESLPNLKPIFLRRLKTGTTLHRVQVVVPHDQRLRKAAFQFAYQRQQAAFLCQGTCILRTAQAVQSAFVAHSDAVPVVVAAVRAHLFHRPSAVYFAVAGDVEVVADVAEAAVAHVVRAAGFKAKALPLRGGRAMDNNQGDGSHRPIHDEMPNTPAKAVATATIALSTMLHTFFLV